MMFSNEKLGNMNISKNVFVFVSMWYKQIIKCVLFYLTGTNETGSDIENVIHEASKILSYVANQLVNSDITIGMYEILQRKKDVFCSLTTAIGDGKQSMSQKHLLIAFDNRTKEIQMFKQACIILDYFLNMCKELLGGVGM